MKFKIKFIISQIIKLTFLMKLFLKTWKIKDNSIYYTKRFSLRSKYLLLPSIPCSKKNILKGQFIPLQRICSEKSDYLFKGATKL